jgi:hypothetical protein
MIDTTDPDREIRRKRTILYTILKIVSKTGASLYSIQKQLINDNIDVFIGAVSIDQTCPDKLFFDLSDFQQSTSCSHFIRIYSCGSIVKSALQFTQDAGGEYAETIKNNLINMENACVSICKQHEEMFGPLSCLNCKTSRIDGFDYLDDRFVRKNLFCECPVSEYQWICSATCQQKLKSQQVSSSTICMY